MKGLDIMNELATHIPNAIILNDIPPYEIQDYDVFDEKDFRKNRLNNKT